MERTPRGQGNRKVMLVFALLVLLLIAFVVWLFMFLSNVELPRPNIAESADNAAELEAETEEPAEAHGLGVLLWSTDQRIEAAFVREDQIYYSLIEHGDRQELVVERLSLDGTVSPVCSVLLETENPMRISGFSGTEAGEFRFLLSPRRRADNSYVPLIYAEYDIDGQIVFWHELADLMPPAERSAVRGVVFADTGEVVIHIWEGNSLGAGRLVIADQYGAVRGEIETVAGALIRMRDGRIVFSGWYEEYLREINVAAGDLGEIVIESGVWGGRHTVVPETAPFDLYLNRQWRNSSERYLFGYDLASGEVTPIINWIAVGEVWDGIDVSHREVLFLSNGNIVAISNLGEFILLAP